MKLTQSELNSLKRAIARYNRKITQLMKSGNEVVKQYLPSKLSYAKTIKSGVSKPEFRQLTRSIDSFIKKGSERIVKTKSGVELPKYEYDELKRRVKIINQRRAVARRNINPIDSGDLPAMGRLKDAHLTRKKGVDEITERNFGSYRKSVYTQSASDYLVRKNALYRKNYETAIRNTFSKAEADYYIAKLRELPDKQFIGVTLNDEHLYIGFVSDEPIELMLRQSFVRQAIFDQFQITGM